MSNRSLTDIRAVITGALGLIGLYLVVCSVLFNSAEEMSKTGGINANLWAGLGLLAMRTRGAQQLSELGAGDGVRIVLDPRVHGNVVVHIFRASGHICDGTAR